MTCWRPLLLTAICLQADHGTQGRQEMAGVRVETWRRARGAVFEAWTELDCPLGTDKAPEAVQLTGEGETSLKGHRYRLKVRTVHCQGALAVQAGSTCMQASLVCSVQCSLLWTAIARWLNAPDQAAWATHLHGLAGTLCQSDNVRCFLQGMDADASRPLPSQGKIVAKHAGMATCCAVSWLPPGAEHFEQLSRPAGKVAEALLELPAAATRDEAAGLAPVIWLTVGLLAMDGFALQLKLKKAAKPKERDAVSGTWYCYHAVGGALTIADEPISA